MSDGKLSPAKPGDIVWIWPSKDDGDGWRLAEYKCPKTLLVLPSKGSYESNDSLDNAVTIIVDKHTRILPASIKTDKTELPPTNLTSLPLLNEATIFDCLRERYARRQIYSDCGSILIAINPYCNQLSSLYTSSIKYLYGCSVSDVMDADMEGRQEGGTALEPHLYRVAAKALAGIQKQHVNSGGDADSDDQSIIISGESGSGKTVSSRHILDYLCHHSSNSKNNNNLSNSNDSRHYTPTFIINTNPILEAFGNASTPRNTNSSRFGKLVRLHFSGEESVLVGGQIECFLLEKSRVDGIAAMYKDDGCEMLADDCVGSEENFHVFHYLLHGLGHYYKDEMESDAANTQKRHRELRANLHLDDERRFAYISSRSQTTVTNNPQIVEESREKWHELLVAMRKCMISEDEQELIFRCLAAILHIGNLEFEIDEEKEDVVKIKDKDNALLRLTRILEPSQGNTNAAGKKSRTDNDYTSVNNENGDETADSAIVNMNRLFTHKQICINTGGGKQEVIWKALESVEECRRAAATVARWMYSRLFEWIVDHLNAQISTFDSDDKDKGIRTINVLDIYGFERLPLNTLEQLCINWSNERLQSAYIHHHLKSEQRLYQAEGLEGWEETMQVGCDDGSECIGLIEGPLGVCALLDEQCRLDHHHNNHSAKKTNVNDQNGLRDEIKGSAASKEDLTFLQKLCEHNAGKNKRFQNNKNCTNDPTFTIKHFAYNVEYDVGGWVERNLDVIPSQLAEVFASHPILQQKPNAKEEAQSPRKGKQTTLSKYKQSLNSLMHRLTTTNRHYIRCLKPNQQGKAFTLEGGFMHDQLVACGVIEAVRVAALGWSGRIQKAVFVEKYLLLHKLNHENDKLKSNSDQLEKSFKLNNKKSDGDEEVIRSIHKIAENANLTLNKHYVIGKTMVFLKNGCISILDTCLHTIFSQKAKLIQSHHNRYTSKTSVYSRRKAAFGVIALFVGGLVARRRVCGLMLGRAASRICVGLVGWRCRRWWSVVEGCLSRKLPGLWRASVRMRGEMSVEDTIAFFSKREKAKRQVIAVWKAAIMKRWFAGVIASIHKIQSILKFKYLKNYHDYDDNFTKNVAVDKSLYTQEIQSILRNHSILITALSTAIKQHNLATPTILLTYIQIHALYSHPDNLKDMSISSNSMNNTNDECALTLIINSVLKCVSMDGDRGWSIWVLVECLDALQHWAINNNANVDTNTINTVCTHFARMVKDLFSGWLDALMASSGVGRALLNFILYNRTLEEGGSLSNQSLNLDNNQANSNKHSRTQSHTSSTIVNKIFASVWSKTTKTTKATHLGASTKTLRKCKDALTALIRQCSLIGGTLGEQVVDEMIERIFGALFNRLLLGGGNGENGWECSIVFNLQFNVDVVVGLFESVVAECCCTADDDCHSIRSVQHTALTISTIYKRHRTLPLKLAIHKDNKSSKPTTLTKLKEALKVLQTAKNTKHLDTHTLSALGPSLSKRQLCRLAGRLDDDLNKWENKAIVDNDEYTIEFSDNVGIICVGPVKLPAFQEIDPALIDPVLWKLFTLHIMCAGK